MSFDTKYGRAFWDTARQSYIIQSGDNKGKLLDHLIYEDVNDCTITEYDILIHLDGNKQNNDIGNLKLLSREEYFKIQSRKRGNKTGYYRVHKQYSDNYKQGFTYVYTYEIAGEKTENISSVNINKLKEKVLEAGLDWFEVPKIK